MKLNERITIQNFNSVIDNEGFNVQEWIDYHTCWCCFRTVGWKEYFSAMQVQAQNTVTFTVRYSNKIKDIIEDIQATKKYRVVYKNNAYDIKYINDLENKHEYVDIKAEIIT